MTTSNRSICGVLLLLACVAVLSPAPASSDPLVIHAGQLLAEPGQAPLERQSIVIDRGRITAVEDGFIDAEEVVDLSTVFVMPGLIDAHVHLAHAAERDSDEPSHQTEAGIALIAARHARISLLAGFTTIVDVGTAGVTGHDNAIYALRDAAARGAIAAPRIIFAGTPIAAPGQDRSGKARSELAESVGDHHLCSGAADCRHAVRHQVEQGADIIVFFNTGSLLAAERVDQTLTSEEMRAIVDTAHELGRKAIADGHHATGVVAALQAGADIVDSVHLYDERVFTNMSERQFLQSHVHGVVGAIGDSEDNLHDGLWGWLPQPLLLQFLAIKQKRFAALAAYDAGIRNIGYASDAGVYRWGENARDLVEFVDRGMPAGLALQTATSNAASMLGLEDEIGAIRPGMAADLIAVAGDPRSDIRTMLDVRFVMRAGRTYKLGGLACPEAVCP